MDNSQSDQSAVNKVETELQAITDRERELRASTSHIDDEFWRLTRRKRSLNDWLQQQREQQHHRERRIINNNNKPRLKSDSDSDVQVNVSDVKFFMKKIIRFYEMFDIFQARFLKFLLKFSLLHKNGIEHSKTQQNNLQGNKSFTFQPFLLRFASFQNILIV